MKEFVKRFGAETWYMKAWSSKEIAAVTYVFLGAVFWKLSMPNLPNKGNDSQSIVPKF
jgi:hypothetical protein